MKGTSYFKIFFLILCCACTDSYTPRPEGYFKIHFPEKKYQVFDKPGYPYSFEYPVYAQIVKDSSFFGDTPENPWWINIFFPQFNGTIYISYKEVGPYTLEKLLNDAFNLTNKHAIRASYIDDSLIQTPLGVHGMFFKVSGEVATANQFFLTDSTRHFLRGALYFNVTPNQDSLQPVNQFLIEDVRHLINTLKWK